MINGLNAKQYNYLRSLTTESMFDAYCLGYVTVPDAVCFEELMHITKLGGDA